MNVSITLDGRIKLELNHEGDIPLLSELLLDVGQEARVDELVNRLGESHINDEDWAEYIKPDLIDAFYEDVNVVKTMVQDASNGDDKELYIDQERCRAWYSTLNQARLQLEAHYSLSEMEMKNEFKEQPAELVAPLIKSNFYNQIQGLILSHFEIF